MSSASEKCEQVGGVFDPTLNTCTRMRLYTEDLTPRDWLHRNHERKQCMTESGFSGCFEQARVFSTVATMANMSDRCVNASETWTGCWTK
jgi:hypothetical protein